MKLENQSLIEIGCYAASDLPPGVVLDDCKMHWQSNGEYLAVSTRSGFVFFCIKEEGIPIDVLEVDRKILVAFAWEPSGNRFAVIHEGDKGPNKTKSFSS
uniref:Translation initiation factor beta propellor-like domain-containing protein n=1 Tax=Brassica oleracea var. oleracea TaxID=109376 RepID=A0A0D3C4N5_BRAOL